MRDVSEESKPFVYFSFDPKDQRQVERFIKKWGDKEELFQPVLPRLESLDTGETSKDLLGDSTLTIVMIGTCTHSYRSVDLEIKHSLEAREGGPNGVLAILFHSLKGSAHLPQRVQDNWNETHTSCYVRCYSEPNVSAKFADWLFDAQRARVKRAHLINNDRELMKKNDHCRICKVVH